MERDIKEFLIEIWIEELVEGQVLNPKGRFGY